MTIGYETITIGDACHQGGGNVQTGPFGSQLKASAYTDVGIPVVMPANIMLAGRVRTSADLWQQVKPHVRAIQHDDGVLILDDSIAEKPYTDENDIICWHYDHSKERMVKGVNFITALYHAQGVSLPVGITLIAKNEIYTEKKDGKEKRRSPIEKNVYFREMVQQAVRNSIAFMYVLCDVWFASAENMRFIKITMEKDFVMPLKSNRKIALSEADKKQGRYVQLGNLDLERHVLRTVYLEGVPFPLLLVKQVFVNEDGSTGVLYLVTSNTSLTYDDITTIYRKRWHVEPYHKSLKQNASLERSPTHTVITQTNHFFAALHGYIKLECLKLVTKRNHFALRAALYARAMRSAFDTLQELRATQTA
ncbi:MAG: transposase [Oscillochloridaceae bacterium umkhey_bin13]